MRAFLFDLDDTLFDHRHGTRVALAAIQRALPALAALPLDLLEERHAIVLEELHAGVLSGALDVDAARLERFRRLVVMHGGSARPEEIEAGAKAYRAAYLAVRRPVPGAVALARAMRAHGATAVISNNVVNEQLDKIAVCGFDECFDAVVISAGVGVAKPDPEIFRIALRRLGARAENAVMIGDSWGADILGARSAGIRAVWFNPLKRPCPDGAAIAAEIGAWEPLDDVVKRILEVW